MIRCLKFSLTTIRFRNQQINNQFKNFVICKGDTTIGPLVKYPRAVEYCGSHDELYIPGDRVSIKDFWTFYCNIFPSTNTKL